MKWLTDPILDTASAIQERAVGLVAGGGKLFHSTVARVPLLSSVEADETATDRHEIHVFLIPVPEAHEEGGYVLFTSQRVPPGFAKANELPRVRIFHLPGPGAESTLRLLLADQFREDLTPADDREEEAERVGDLLARAGEIIEKESGKVTGGLLLIGGAIALVNPLVGAGLAAKALIPSVGGKLGTEGLKQLGKRLNRFSQRREERKLDRAAERAVDAVENLSLVNPFLAALEAGNPSPDILMLPVEERFDNTVGCDAAALQTVTARALLAIDSELGFPESFANWRDVLPMYLPSA